jgi:hypothetical protein
MGNFSISHYTAIQIEPGVIRLRYLVDLAEIPTFQARLGFDTDGDGVFDQWHRCAHHHDQEEQGENSSGKNGDDNQAGQPNDGKANPEQNQQPGNKRDANNPFENSSLMSKMKDAFQNLLSKVKPQPQPGQQQQGAGDQKSQGKSQQGAKQPNGKDGQQQGSQQGDPQVGAVHSLAEHLDLSLGDDKELAAI